MFAVDALGAGGHGDDGQLLHFLVRGHHNAGEDLEIISQAGFNE